MEGQPFIEFNRARGPVGGTFPDIVEPKEADVVEDEGGNVERRTVDEAAKLSLSRYLLTLVLGLVKSTPATCPSFHPLSLHSCLIKIMLC